MVVLGLVTILIAPTVLELVASIAWYTGNDDDGASRHEMRGEEIKEGT